MPSFASPLCRRSKRLALTAGCLAALANCAAHADYTVERLLRGLNQPVDVRQAPGDPASLYVVERRDNSTQLGRITKYDMMTRAKTTFLDVSGTVLDDGGLLSMAFHPDYQTNGLFYVTYTDGATNRLDEYALVGGTPQFNRRILQYTNPIHVWHTINQPFFRPNGNANELFVTTGDGGTQASEGGFNPALIESPNSIFGKVLKIDLTAAFPTPAADATHAGIDVVALGIRNPYRGSFDRTTGDFYFGDVGFTAVEEVDFIPASHFANPAATPLDFGWTSREGTIQNPFLPGSPGSPQDLDPIFDYPHGGTPLPHPAAFSGNAVVGGYVYRGPIAELQGRYFVSDFVNGNVYSGQFNRLTNPADYDGTNLTGIVNHTVAYENEVGGGADIQFISSFAEDQAGNLYIVKMANSYSDVVGEGEIYRLLPSQPFAASVNRDTGAISLTNVTASPVAITAVAVGSPIEALDPSALTPITGHYDLDGDSSIDDNDPWTIISPAASHALVYEQSTGDAGAFSPGEEIVLTSLGGWTPSPNEDVFVSVLLADGTVTIAQIEFTGNGGQPFARSDLDFNGVLDPADWFLFVENQDRDLASVSLAEAYALGDLNADRHADFKDFRLFQSDYIAANGQAAFAALFNNVPEPTSLTLLLGSAVVLLFLTRNSPLIVANGR